MALSDIAAGVASALSTGANRLRNAVFAPQALAEPVPQLIDGYFYAADSIKLIDRHVSYSALYRAQPSVSAVINKRAELLATLPVRVWDTAPASGNIEETDGPLIDLLRDPTAGMMPAWSFWRWLSATKDIYGEAFALKRRDANGTVVRIDPVTPVRVAIERDDQGHLNYVFTLAAGTSEGVLTAPESDVIAWLNYNPQNIMRGMSQLEPLRATLAAEDAARRANGSFWKNGARPGTVIKHPGELSQKAADKIRAQYDSGHGGADLTGSTAVLDEGMTVEQIQLTQEEAQYVESRKLNLNEVCMVFDMPPAAIHALLEKASFTSSVEQLRSLGRDTMPPIVESLASALQTQLVSEFYGDGAHVIRFGLDEMLRGDFESLAQTLPGLVTSGTITPNQAATFLGLPLHDDPMADRLFANQATQPLGTPVAAAMRGGGDGAGWGDDLPKEGERVRSDAATHDDGAGTRAVKPASIRTRAVAGLSGQITMKADRAAMRATAVKAMRTAVAAGFGRQAGAIRGAAKTWGSVDDDFDAADLAAGLYSAADWGEDLAGELRKPTASIVDAFGRRIAGAGFDVDKAKEWIAASVKAAADSMNSATADGLAAALSSLLDGDKPDDMTAAMLDAVNAFTDEMTGARVDQAAETRATFVSQFGEVEGATQKGLATKTWVAGPNPRSSHAQMDGETVDVDDTFSNGMRWPCDISAGDYDEVAGCNCTLSFD